MSHGTVLRVDVVVRPTYTCRACGIWGTGRPYVVQATDLEHAHELVSMTPRAKDMPFGWASYHHPQVTEFACPEHKK